MDLSLRSLHHTSPVHTALTTSTHVFSINNSSPTPRISLSPWQPASDTNSPPSLIHSHSEWHSASGHPFHPLTTIDHTSERVYAVLKDRRHIITFPFSHPHGDVMPDEDPKPLKFESPLQALQRLPRHKPQQEEPNGEDGDFVFAFSETGECALLCMKSGNLCVLRTLETRIAGHVLAAVAFEDDYVLVLCVLREQVTVYPLFLERGNALESTSVKPLLPLKLPAPPPSVVASYVNGKNFVLGFDFDRESGAVLYADGTVQVLQPGTTGTKVADDCFGLWRYSRREDATSDRAAATKLAHAFQLSTGINEADTGVLRPGQYGPSRGGLVRLGKSYIAVGYGQYISVWDVRYFVGHGLVRIRGTVETLSAGRHKASALLGSVNGLQEVLVLDADVFAPVTLGLAMTRKGKCEEIIVRMDSTADAAPIRSQPVTVAATKTAAEAGGRVERVFRSLMQALDEAEQKIVRALLSREQAGSAEEVARLTAEYTTVNKRVRRGNLGEEVDTGLARLPSERLAAVSVARCLYELHFGNYKFLVPLIDMVGTGVVSNEAVMAVLGMSDSWEMGVENEGLNLLSIIDPLLSSEICWNALEAVVTRVLDLSEPDIVRVVQVVVRMTHGKFEEDMGRRLRAVEKNSDDDEDDATLLTRSTNLLMKCVMASAARARLIESLKQIPVADAIAILSRLEQVLKCRSFEQLEQRTRVPRVPPLVQLGFFNGNEFGDNNVGKYRGVGDWLSKDCDARRAKNRSVEVQGCIAWIGHLIDAHLTNLVMDESGQLLARRLLQLVRRRRKEYEMLKSLYGVSWHLSAGRPIPRREDPLYKRRTIEIPMFASLQ